jgi:hypothetical protein
VTGERRVRVPEIAEVPAPGPRKHQRRHRLACGRPPEGLLLRRYGHALSDEVAGAGAALSAWRVAREA